MGDQMERDGAGILPAGDAPAAAAPAADPNVMHVMSYSSDILKERTVTESEFSQIHLWYFPIPVRNEGDRSVTWIHVQGAMKPDMMAQLGMLFGLHDMLVADIMSPDERPKAENYGNFYFVVVKEIEYDTSREDIESHQLSFVLGPDFLLSFQESGRDLFGGLMERIRLNQGRLRKLGVDYLLYSLLDLNVDNYFITLEKIYHKLTEIEDILLSEPTTETLGSIHNLKREIILMRSIMLPSVEVVRNLQKGETHLIEEQHVIYYKDVYEHMMQATDMFASFGELLSDMVDTYTSDLNYKMNEAMKILTVMSTIFIPLTFISSVYGMNFEHMPELSWRWGYPVILGLMASLMGGMLFYFKRKKWF